MLRRLPIWALAASTLVVVARADDAPPLTEELFLGDVPQVLSATRLRQPLSDTPASVTVIDRRLIDASGAMTIPDILRLVPGMQVGHPDGIMSVVTYHGLSDAYARHMQVLIDGRSVYTPAFGGVVWDSLPLAIDDIERIEVIRGPNGVTYGANAFSATINIITREPVQDTGSYARYTHGSIKTDDAVLRYGSATQDTHHRATLGYHTDDGFANVEDYKRVSTLTYRGDYRHSDHDLFDVQFGYRGGTYSDGEKGDLIDPARYRDATSSFLQAHWTHSASVENEYKVQFYHNYYRSSDTYQTALLSQILGVPPANIVLLFGRPDQQLVIAEDARIERYNLDFQNKRMFGATLRTVWGAEARLDRVTAQGWFNTSEPIDTRLFRVFSDNEWRPLPDWVVNVGAMYEHNDITGGNVSPRLALNYHASPGQTLRAAASRAYRTPSYFETYADTAARFSDGAALDQLFVGSQTLLPEQITSYEIGYLGKFANPQVFIDLRIFNDKIRNMIAQYHDTSFPELSPAPDGAITFNNDGEADLSGAETQIKWAATPRTQFIAGYSYTRQHGKFLRMLPDEYTITDSSTPLHTGNLIAIHRFENGIESSVSYYKVGNFRFLGARDYAGDFDTINARLAYKWRFGRDVLGISFVGQNLAGTYYDYDARRVFDKRYFLNLVFETR